MHHRQIPILGFFLALVFLVASTATAMVSAQEAQRLKTDLTPLGAERAGSADGIIPEWTGGLTSAPAGITYKPGYPYADPFANDKVLFTITAQNLDKYADKLSVGQKALFKKYPEYKIDVYKTRRTQAAPQWYYDNTFKNATETSLTKEGLGVVGGYGGVPFPIPHRGEEVMFNHLLRWQGGARRGNYWTGTVGPDGTYADGGSALLTEVFPYDQKSGSAKTFSGILMKQLGEMASPQRRRGEVTVLIDPLNQTHDERKAWQYLPGVRRVRRAPEIAYDWPNPAFSGMAYADEVYLWWGALDRYDWKIVGKKEMYIPYNNYKADLVPLKEVTTGRYLNPNDIRWELHRVWVVEATLKKGARHPYAKRTFYVDEDSWIVHLTDQYDGQGNLWRTGVATSLSDYELPGVIQRITAYYDLQTDVYGVAQLQNNLPGKNYVYYQDNPFPEDSWTPENVRRLGRR